MTMWKDMITKVTFTAALLFLFVVVCRAGELHQPIQTVHDDSYHSDMHDYVGQADAGEHYPSTYTSGDRMSEEDAGTVVRTQHSVDD